MLTIFVLVIYGLLTAFDFLLLVRAVCSWVPSFRDSMVYNLAFKVTEPILRPVRDALFRIEWVRRCPIDLSFLLVVIMTSVISNLLLFLI